jgi:hypothetical protein
MTCLNHVMIQCRWDGEFLRLKQNHLRQPALLARPAMALPSFQKTLN